jgi:enoyl-CoA hydratase/carnithine racemase
MSEVYQDILYAVRERVATITLNRPDRLNAYTPNMGDELRAALLRAEEDEAVRAIVLTGAGRGFCAGADMARLSAAVAGKMSLKVSETAPSIGSPPISPSATVTSLRLASRSSPASMARWPGSAWC